MNGAIKDWEPFPALVSQKDGLFTKARNHLPICLFLVHLFMSIKPRDHRVVRRSQSLWTFSCVHRAESVFFHSAGTIENISSQNQNENLLLLLSLPGQPIRNPLPSTSLPFPFPSLYQLTRFGCQSLRSSLWVLLILTPAGTASATSPYRA